MRCLPSGSIAVDMLLRSQRSGHLQRAKRRISLRDNSQRRSVRSHHTQTVQVPHAALLLQEPAVVHPGCLRSDFHRRGRGAIHRLQGHEFIPQGNATHTRQFESAVPFLMRFVLVFALCSSCHLFPTTTLLRLSKAL